MGAQMTPTPSEAPSAAAYLRRFYTLTTSLPGRYSSFSETSQPMCFKGFPRLRSELVLFGNVEHDFHPLQVLEHGKPSWMASFGGRGLSAGCGAGAAG
jgi:hypothetical protein